MSHSVVTPERNNSATPRRLAHRTVSGLINRCSAGHTCCSSQVCSGRSSARPRRSARGGRAQESSRREAPSRRRAEWCGASSMVTTMPPSTRMSAGARSEPELLGSPIETQIKQQRYSAGCTSQHVNSRRQHSLRFAQLLVSQRVDGVEIGCFLGWIKTKEDSHGAGEEKSNGDDGRADEGRPLGPKL